MEKPVSRPDPKRYSSPELIVYGSIETITQANAGNTHDDGVFYCGAPVSINGGIQPAGSVDLDWGKPYGIC